MSQSDLNTARLLFDLRSLPTRSFKILYPDAESLGTAIDASSLYDFIETFIARSVVGVAVLAPERVSREFKTNISSVYRNRINFIDSSTAIRKVRTFLGPVFQETGSDFNGFRLAFNDTDSSIKLDLLFAVCKNLVRYLIAVEHSLFLDLDIAAMRQSIRDLRISLSDTNIRYKLSVLESVFSSYEAFEQPALKVNRISSNEALDLFIDLVNEDLYIALSSEINSLTTPICVNEL